MSQVNPPPSNQSLLKYGFLVILILMFLLGGIGIYQTFEVTLKLDHLVKVTNAKLQYAHDMRDAIRQRQILMYQMLISDDPFSRDDQLTAFYQKATDYRIARDKLSVLLSDESEKAINQRLMVQTRIAQPINQELAENIDEIDLKKGYALLTLATEEQFKVMAILDELVISQKAYAENISIQANKNNKNLVLGMLALFAVLVIIAVYISITVTRYVTRNHQELILKNELLEEARDAALSATRAKSAFLATMSHEIRTPLTGVIGFAEVIYDSSINSEKRAELTSLIIKSGRHLLGIINDILDLSKIESNKIELERIELDFVKLIQEIRFLIEPQVTEKGIAFSIEYSLPVPKNIIGDPLRIKQILINLCSNAIKFTDIGKISLLISYDSDHHLLFIDVVDTGIGMTKEQTEKVFEAFQQADSSTTRKYGGTGLGLSLTKQLVELMGGSIKVESVSGVGSRFRIGIPYTAPETPLLVQNQLQIKHKKEVSRHNLSRVSGLVLLAEDNSTNQELLTLLIENIGANVDVVENGKQAVEQALSGTYDLILMDMQMPVMSGLEAVQELRLSEYMGPIYALTANVLKRDMEKCLNAGCDGFLTKPVDREHLNQVICKHLKMKDDNNFNNEIIHADFQNDNSSIRRISHKFVQKLPSTMNNCKDLLLKNELDQLASELHKLKGLGSVMGYPQITELSEDIEFEIAKKNFERVHNGINDLDIIIKKIQKGNTGPEIH